MPSVWLKRFVLALGASLLSAALLNAALPKHKLSPESPSLSGQLLIASPAMGDPRFHRTVILIVQHSKSGALGIAINRPVEERPLARLLEGLGESDAAAEGVVRIFAGGPVQPEIGFVVHSADYEHQGTINIDGHLAVTASPDILRDIGRKQGPQKALVAFGYAGWGPGQLEGELARNDWLTIRADLALVFDESRERVWDEAMARQSRDP